MKIKLLVVDDDPDFCGNLRRLFDRSGYLADFEPDGDRGIQRGMQRPPAEPYDLLIVDVMLLGEDCFEALRRVREQSEIPIIVLSARADHSDRVSGLRAGADDYVAKPCLLEELEARVEAILRRVKADVPRAQESLEIGELRLLPASRDVYFQGRRLDLTAMEVEILECLMRSCGKAVSRDRLSQRLYNRLSEPFERNIDTHVSRIRRKMGDGRTMILSIRGTGYQLRIPPGTYSKPPASVTLLHNWNESNQTR